MNLMDKFLIFINAMGASAFVVAGLMLLDALKAIAFGAGSGIFF